MIVLDSSAVLALIFAETGAEAVLSKLPGGAISTVNHGEVLARMVERGQSFAEARKVLGRMQLNLVPFDQSQAERAAELRHSTRRFGLSLGDRACIALAERLGASVMTADRRWAEAPLPVEIELIR